MKKTNLILCLSALTGLGIAFNQLSGSSTLDPVTKHASAASESIEFAAVGTVDPTSPMRSKYQSGSYGFKRLDDRRMAVTGTPGWGMRCNYGKAFKKDKFEVQLDMSSYARGDFMALMFNNISGSYVSEAGCVVDMDILRYYEERPHDYLITLNKGGTGNGHNTSVEGWTNNVESPWLDAYSGVIVTSEEDMLTIGFEILELNKVAFYVNDFRAEFSMDVIAGNLAEEFYIGFGTGGNPGVHNLVVNYAEDNAIRAYYAEDGTYYKTKNAINAFLEAYNSTTIETVDQFNELVDMGQAIDLSKLYDYDRNYLSPNYETAMEELEKIGNERFENPAKIKAFENASEKAVEAAKDLTTDEKIVAAIATVQAADAANDAVKALSLTSDQSFEYQTLLAAYEAARNTIAGTASDSYKVKVNDAVTKMSAASDIASVNEAEVAFGFADSRLSTLMDETELATLNAQLEQARANFVAKFSLKDASKFSGANSNVLVSENEDKFGIRSYGESATGSSLGSGIMSKERFDLAEFSMTYDIKNFGQHVIGFVDKAEFFSAADDQSVQEHSGLIFLIRPKDDKTAVLETYLIDGTCNRFFDGQLTMNLLEIPLDGKITFECSIKTVEASGIYDNYFEFSFNGKKYETPLIKAASLLGAFNDGKGYLMIGSQGATFSDPLVMEINDINGHKMNEASYLKEIDYSPKLSVESLAFEKGSTKNLVFAVNPMLESITGVYVDDAKLDKSSYTYTRNSTLTLKATYLDTLEVGEHTLKVVTAKGEKALALAINEKGNSSSVPSTPDGPDTPEEPSGNEGGLDAGAIAGIVIGSLVGVAAVAGCVTYFVKKKKAK